MIRVLLVLIGAYRYALSPMLGRHCRFHPSCSEYAQDALGRYGLVQGGWLSARRVCRCHPWNTGGFDPVP